MSEDLNELADEYVVGLLSEEDARDVERRAETEPALAEAISRAAERFLEVDLTEAGAEVGVESWDAIARRLTTATGTGDDETPPAPANANTPLSRPSGWKSLAQLAMAACVVLAVGLGWMLGTAPQRPQYVAVLVSDAGEPQALIEAFLDDHIKVVPLEAFNAPGGQTLQIWTLPDVPDAKPVSLGLLDEVITVSVQGPDLPEPVAGQLYEITIEPAGGSPTGLPTGPIVGKGFAKNVL